MILLITSNVRGPECAEALRQACEQSVELANSFRHASVRVRGQEYSAIVIDQAMVEPSPVAMSALLERAGTAIPVYLNFALSKTERLVREVQQALRRSQTERLRALRAAAAALHNQLNTTVTGILLSSQLALSVPELPPAAEVKMRFVHELAESLRKQLEMPAT